jgi:DNA polymerase
MSDAPTLRTVTLASANDLEGFRRACRRLWAEQVAPERVGWRIADAADVAAAGAIDDGTPSATTSAASAPPPVNAPAAFMALAESVVLHRDPGRFGLLYRLLWRLQTEPGLRRDPLDADWVEAERLARAARRENPPRTLPALRDALERCRECPIGEHATQAVPGEGPERARLMFVGEQPGDREDLVGRPFVGPAGQLFARALDELGIAREQVYITNAVKHFKFELRGTRRIHKTPAQEEAAACLHWLESEIGLVDPEALVALGATAARQLMGRSVAVTRERGRWLERSDGRRVLIALHPSALLRMEPEDKAEAYRAWLDDLRHAVVPRSTDSP